MGKHVSEQSRHLKTKDEPQDFPEIDEIDEESRGAKKAKRGFADCGSISFGGIAPVVFAAVLLAALSFLPAEGWMKCVAFLIPFVIAGFAVLMDAIDKLIERKYFEAEQITLVAAIAVFALGFAPTVIFEIIIASYVSVNVMSYIYALFGMLLLGSALIAIGSAGNKARHGERGNSRGRPQRRAGLCKCRRYYSGPGRGAHTA